MRGEALRPQPKKRPALLDKRAKVRERDKLDREQRAICKARSGGQCEVLQPFTGWLGTTGRCKRRATENHHLIGGIGQRNIGRSIYAEHRLHVCKRCHDNITGKVLVPIRNVDGDRKWIEDAARVVFQRLR